MNRQSQKSTFSETTFSGKRNLPEIIRAYQRKAREKMGNIFLPLWWERREKESEPYIHRWQALEQEKLRKGISDWWRHRIGVKNIHSSLGTARRWSNRLHAF